MTHDENPVSPDRGRTIDLSVEVPGTPEEVWDAIATGPGISSWMHPTRVEEHVGGRFSYDMGGGWNASATVAAWDPPHRFATEGAQWEPNGDAPAERLADEWLVEARSGGTCVVRMVMSGFGDGAVWDDEIEGMTHGMRAALENLRTYLTHFRGRHATFTTARTRVPAAPEEAWAALLADLGLTGERDDEETAWTGAGPAPLVGTVERRTGGRFLQVLTHDPAPGLVGLVIFTGEDGTQVHLGGQLFGGVADAEADAAAERWEAWILGRLGGVALDRAVTPPA